MLIAALIALVNMLGYGIIIPILYSYSKKFGLTDFQNGLLFAIYSICQFISTPIIGRMSDKYGRRPALLISIFGTAFSFLLMAIAKSPAMLFVARAVDGITAGNIPVILAVVSDTTKPENRAKAFGFIGSAFNFGFIFGPAIAAFTIRYGDAVPFWIAFVITSLAVLLTALFLPETNKNLGQTHEGKLFDFKKMWYTLFDPNVGVTFVISMLFFLAFSCAVIYGFQPFTINILKITPAVNAQLFTLFGIVGLVSQNLIVGPVTKWLGDKKSFMASNFFVAVAFFFTYLSRNLLFFTLSMVVLGVFNSIAQTMITTILSAETDEKSQGTIMGLNASYQSVGMIIGPILGGLVATISIALPFLIGSILVLVCFGLSSLVLQRGVKKEALF